MQKLNGREYYVIVIVGIIAIFQSALLISELFSSTSPLVTSEDGSFVNVQQGYIINIANTFLQIVLNVTAFVLLLKIKKPGWIIAFSMITFYSIVYGIVLGNAAMGGIVDALFYIGCFLALMLLLAIIFLLIPSTMKKFHINKLSFIPVIIIMGILYVIYFLIPA